MKITYNSIDIYIQEDYEAMSKKAANMIAGQLNLKTESILGLATGSTMEGMYKELVALYKDDSIDFGEATSFNLDEYYQLPADNEQSYAWYMNHHLFQHVNMPPNNINIPDGVTNNVDEVCKDYDRMIEAAGNVDLQILGIGTNGHIGFNEPDIKFEAGTHLVKLDDDTIHANGRFFPSLADVPKEAFSMGIRNIMHAKKVVLMSNGSVKSQALKEMIFGPVTPVLPASILQLHNDVTVIVEKESAKLLLDEFKSRGLI